MFTLSSFAQGVVRYLPSLQDDAANEYYGLPQHFIIKYTKKNKLLEALSRIDPDDEINNTENQSKLFYLTLPYIYATSERRGDTYMSGVEICKLLSRVDLEDSTNIEWSDYKEYCDEIYNFILDAFEEINCQLNARVRKNYVVDTIVRHAFDNTLMLTRKDIYNKHFNIFKNSLSK